MKGSQTILVTRFSAIGDVAMVVPLLKALLERHPQLQLVMLTQSFLHDLFRPLPRVHLPKADLRGKDGTPVGLWRLSRRLKQSYALDGVVDLHDVLRSQLLRTYLFIQGIPFTRIQKDRKARQLLTRRNKKQWVEAKHSFLLYQDTFARMGFPLDLSLDMPPKLNFAPFASPELDLTHPRPWIGLAPFASRTEKMLPLPRMQQVASQLLNQGASVFLFGGPREQKILSEWKEEDPRLQIAPYFPLAQEMYLIQHLDLMVGPDSANGHLARLVGTPTLTIWGPTHPLAGFRPLGPSSQQHDLEISTEELPCRPCFVVKAKPCYRGDHACMQRINTESLLNRVQQVLTST